MKKHILKAVLIVYIVVSLVYIAFTIWQNFKTRYAVASYQKGRNDTVLQLIQQAENTECKSFNVYNDQKTVQLINVSCLQAKQEEQAEATEEE